MPHRSDRQQVNSTNPESRFGDDGERMEPCCAVRIWARTRRNGRCNKAACRCAVCPSWSAASNRPSLAEVRKANSD